MARLVQHIFVTEGLSDDAAYGTGLPPSGDAPDGCLSAVALLVEVVVIVVYFPEDGVVGGPLPDEDLLFGYFSHHEAIV